jgi:peptidoglycan/xylan/chitin deacetylase (PgdA/CDA1 family)
MAEFGVSLSFDVDGLAGLACRPIAGGWEQRLSGRSEAEFGLRRGVARVLERLAVHGVPATFYVPGTVALAEPGLIGQIAQAGHEIAHHGYAHLPAHQLDANGQRHEIEAGLGALETVLGARPTGYRSPAWELTPVTLELLAEHGFLYDSSLMGDDRPYRIGALIELPVHWSLDDVPFFAYGPGIPHAPPADPDAVARAWTYEHDLAFGERRHVTYTMHPEIIARGPRITILERLLDHLHAHNTPARTHSHTASASACAGVRC